MNTPAKTVQSRFPSGSPLAARFSAKPAKPQLQADRFVPARMSGSALDIAQHKVQYADENGGVGNLSPSKAAYKAALEDNFMRPAGEARILSFRQKAPEQPKGYYNATTALYSRNSAPQPLRRSTRTLPQAPDRVLDAPEIVDDYYLNLLDWSSQNVVAVALGPTVYCWNASSGSISQLCTTQGEDDYVTSLAWAADGRHLSVGTNSCQVQLWDAEREKQVRLLRGHSGRVSALAWNKSTLSSGGRDTSILNHDVRIKEHVQGRLQAHTQEVCGLKWSPSGTQLASGGNDNMLHIWQAGATEPLHRLSAHQAAVKALAWCPFQSNLLASGGGTADRCIKTWNTLTGAMLNSVDTKSQVCALQWNRHERELLSSHGFSQNQLCLWRYPTMTKMAEFTGHTARVLHLAQSPDGSTVCSAAADETLHFWRCFGDAPQVAKKKASEHSESMLRSVNIRLQRLTKRIKRQGIEDRRAGSS